MVFFFAVVRTDDRSLSERNTKGSFGHYCVLRTRSGGAAMFTTLAFFLIAILLMLGIVADSFLRRYRR